VEAGELTGILVLLDVYRGGNCFPIIYGRWRAERIVSYRWEQRLTGDVTALTNWNDAATDSITIVTATAFLYATVYLFTNFLALL